MWSALFAAVGEGFRMVSSLWGKSPAPEPQPEPVDSSAARAGTAAGAAANHASHIAGPKK
jgi:hypothetical protein